MRRSFGLVLVGLLLASPVFAHDDEILDPHNATVGVRLELSEVPRTAASAENVYQLRVTGASRDTVFNLWTQDFGALFRMVASGVRLDESGQVVSSTPGKTGQPPRSITIGPGPYPQGAAWSVALVSVDRKIRTFSAVIPRPLISRSGICMVQLELVSYRGDRFVATGAGFPPGGEVTIESVYAGRTIEKRQTISSEGRLPLEIISHATIGTEHSATYRVRGQSCEVAIDYPWGARALARR